MSRFHKLFNKVKCSVIGMVHVNALPGTPLYNGNTKQIISDAVNEAIIYRDCDIHGILVENMHDVPYVRPNNLTPEITSMMTRICTEIKKVLPDNIPCGVQILAGCNKEAIAVAKAAGFQFIRAEGFVFSHIADEGFTDACAGSLLRYRRLIDADDILVFADVKKKHSSHAITADVSLSETVKAAKFFLADGIVLTGTSTGDPTDASELAEVKQATKEQPVLIGSGVTKSNLEDYLSSDAVIIGSHFKVDGIWENKVDRERVTNFMREYKKLQNDM
ncbi:uncharacterized protein F13E9.13, mitochondrial [Xylocopa sonorina]|uniref:uncharacterized protein F13E9.13, mitochondrial n=1 Tax=Xylocopa sonorina TaxID=1818115 RepID=UPI00403AD11D